MIAREIVSIVLAREVMDTSREESGMNTALFFELKGKRFLVTVCRRIV